MKAPALLIVVALAVSGCGGNVNTTPLPDAFAVPAVSVIASPSPVQPFSSLAAAGMDAGTPVVPLFAIPNVPTNLGPSGIVLWGTKDPVTGDIGAVTEAAVFGLEPPGGQVHAFFDTAQLPVLFRDDASGYAIAVTYTSGTSVAVTLCDPTGIALAQASATVVNGVAESPGAATGGSCAVDLGAALPDRGAQGRSVTQTTAGVATNVSDLGELAPLFSSVTYVSGIGTALTAILRFKQHKDNPTQVPIGTPIALIFVAAALLFLPTILNVVGQSLFAPSQVASIDGVSPAYVPPPTGTTASTERFMR